MSCLHESFQANVDVKRMTKDEGAPSTTNPVVGYMADVTLLCAVCGTAFEFIGAPCGMSGARPMASIDALELRCPIRPAGSQEACDIPSFAVRVVQS